MGAIKKGIGLLVVCLLSALVCADEVTVTVDNRIQVYLTNERGEPQSTFFFSPGQKSADEVVFRHFVPKDLNNYSSWVLEISEPKENLFYRMAFNGALSFLIHWDGMFDNDRGIVPGKQYFIRLLLVSKEKRLFSSPWAFFMTAERDTDAAPVERVDVEMANLFVQLTGSFNVVQANSSNFRSTVFPNLGGDFGVYWDETHRFGLKFDVTSNIFTGWNFDVDGNDLRYSDISLSYRYRLFGKPPRRPMLPMVPPYAKGAGHPLSIDPGWFGAPFNLEVGMRLFSAVLAGSPGQKIDDELPSESRGLALTVNTDFTFGPFRTYLNLDVGSSVFLASITHVGGGVACVYDRLESIAPGVQFQYTLLTGYPDAMSRPGAASISSQLVFAGAVLVFKVS